MGSSRIKKYDRNRFRKVYPRIRVLPSNSFRATKEMIIETMEVDMEGLTTKTFDLAEQYKSAPTIVLTPFDNEGDVNVYVTSVQVGVGVPPGRGLATVTISSSVGFAGKVLVQSILIID